MTPEEMMEEIYPQWRREAELAEQHQRELRGSGSDEEGEEDEEDDE